MLLRWTGFRDDCSGAVTAEWVVLTVVLIGMGILMLGPIAFNAGNSSDGVASYVRDVPVGYDNK